MLKTLSTLAAGLAALSGITALLSASGGKESVRGAEIMAHLMAAGMMLAALSELSMP